jgi:hypothetical protein
MAETQPEEERFLGGVAATGIDRLNFGIYATDRRLFGVRSRWYPLGGDKGMIFPDYSSKKTIPELERKHNFVFRKDEIAQLELIKPSFFSTGYLWIRPKEGKPVRVRVTGFNAFGALKTLLDAFFPEVVKQAN